MNSLQSRLGMGLTVSLIISFSGLWLLVNLNIQNLAEEYIYSRLEHDADTILGSLEFNTESQPVVDTNRIDQVYNKPFSGHYFVIRSENQTLYSRSLWDQNLPISSVEKGQQYRLSQPGPEQQSLVVLSQGLNKQGQDFTLLLAEDINPVNNNIQQFKKAFTLLSLVILMFLLFIQIIILRFSLKPIYKTDLEIKSLERGELDKLSTDSPKELVPLINEVNHLLNLMQQRLQRSRNALGDLAHAIKKPLTVIQQLAEKSNCDDSGKKIMLQQTGVIYQISDRILKRARLAGHSHSGTIFSFKEDLPALIKILDIIYNDKLVQFSLNLPDDRICATDREDMLELLGNLLDNAYKWCKQKVILTVQRTNYIQIVIEDDGPGAEPDKIDQLANRGVRLDENTIGHGFGLAIVTDIVHDYAGSIELGHSSRLGGFKVDIVIPLD